MTQWTFAQRVKAFDPGILQGLLKLIEKPQIISLAGGLPAAQTFPVDVMAKACQKVLESAGANSLQYSAGEGYTPLREWLANDLKKQGIQADAEHIITTGSQQGLDLIGKLLLDQSSLMDDEQRTALAQQAKASGVPLVEDNPYGDL